MPSATASTQPAAPLDSPGRRRLPLLLRAAWYGLNQTFRRRLAHLKLTPDQFTVLRTLHEQAGITQRQLAHFMSSDPNTVAALLERMEQAGLIGRQAHERDRRANRLRVKPAGRRRYAAARDIALELQREVLGRMPEADREPFLENLERVATACRESLGRTGNQ